MIMPREPNSRIQTTNCEYSGRLQHRELSPSTHGKPSNLRPKFSNRLDCNGFRASELCGLGYQAQGRLVSRGVTTFLCNYENAASKTESPV
jgi:hypothetical protein